MMFQEALAAVVDGTPGALAGAIMGSDGIAVDEYHRRPEAVDLSSLAVEFQAVLEQAHKVSRALYRDDRLEELVLTTRRHQVLFRQIDEEYFIAIALEPTALLGKARYLVRSLLNDLRERL